MYIPTGGFGWVTAGPRRRSGARRECLVTLQVGTAAEVDDFMARAAISAERSSRPHTKWSGLQRGLRRPTTTCGRSWCRPGDRGGGRDTRVPGETRRSGGEVWGQIVRDTRVPGYPCSRKAGLNELKAPGWSRAEPGGGGSGVTGRGSRCRHGHVRDRRVPGEQQRAGPVEPAADEVAVRREAVLAAEDPHQVRRSATSRALEARPVVVEPVPTSRAAPRRGRPGGSPGAAIGSRPQSSFATSASRTRPRARPPASGTPCNPETARARAGSVSAGDRQRGAGQPLGQPPVVDVQHPLVEATGAGRAPVVGRRTAAARSPARRPPAAGCGPACSPRRRCRPAAPSTARARAPGSCAR